MYRVVLLDIKPNICAKLEYTYYGLQRDEIFMYSFIILTLFIFLLIFLIMPIFIHLPIFFIIAYPMFYHVWLIIIQLYFKIFKLFYYKYKYGRFSLIMNLNGLSMVLYVCLLYVWYLLGERILNILLKILYKIYSKLFK